MKNIFVIIIGSFLLMGCQKDKNKYPYSTWIVTKGNQIDTFKTNNIRIEGVTNHPIVSNSRTVSSLDGVDWFHLVFMLNYFPIRGEFPLWDYIHPPTDNQIYALLYFYYQDYNYNKVGYGPVYPGNNILIASTDKKNIIYTLPKTRFINGGDLSDTIYVEGVFKVPKEY